MIQLVVKCACRGGFSSPPPAKPSSDEVTCPVAGPVPVLQTRDPPMTHVVGRDIGTHGMRHGHRVKMTGTDRSPCDFELLLKSLKHVDLVDEL